ncbi:hypothetical protein [Salinithrix halophila]|uniref:Uncharacterized protein n=1 Tax=Salinithrix halophila TaxID=1485204 RepID=A0ABV8JD57_9BACL
MGGRLEKYAKKSKRKSHHQYPWKPETEMFALFQLYCDRLNLSVNEALCHLVEEEISNFKKELTKDQIEDLVVSFEDAKEERPKKTTIAFTPMFDPEEDESAE